MSNKFYLDQLKQLVGHHVVAVVSDAEGEFFGLQLQRGPKQKKVLWFQSDDEGNGPGSFSIEEAK